MRIGREFPPNCESPGITLIVAFVVIRTAFLTQPKTCEPRYVVEYIPVVLALGAQALRNRPWRPAPTLS